jgi:hypothetical protein
MLRKGSIEDLDILLSLRKQFGHSMLYQKDPGVMTSCLLQGEVMVYVPQVGDPPEGFYHLVPLDSEDNLERIRCYKQIPEEFLLGVSLPSNYRIGVIMQGACHRDIFRSFIDYYKSLYKSLWCYCSAKSSRIQAYKELGFSFSPENSWMFFNVNKGGLSTYCLGIWIEDKR